MKNKIELFFYKENANKKLKMIGLFQIGILLVIVGLLYYHKLDTKNFIVIILADLISVSYMIFMNLKIINYPNPGLTIYSDYMEMVEIDSFIGTSIKSVNYDDIKTLGMEIHHGKYSREVLCITLKNEKNVEYRLKQLFNIDNDALCKLIHEVNPNVKILNIGTFEYDD